MLDEIHVANFGVIEDLTIEIKPGMTVISGETGAGKTLIVDALSMLGGQRAPLGLIRTGAVGAKIEARFHTAAAEELVLSRYLAANDPSKAYVNGSIARVADLSAISSSLFHIYGQHDAQALLSQSAQAATLDHISGIDFSPLAEARSMLASYRKRLKSLGGDERSRRREADLCQAEFDEIASANIQGFDEEDKAKEELDLVANALAFKELLQNVHALLIDAEERPTAMDLLGEARRLLANSNRFQQHVDRISTQIETLRDIGHEIYGELEKLEADPGRLEELQQRLLALTKLKRKYGDTLGAVLQYQKQVFQRIEELSSFEAIAGDLESKIEGFRADIETHERLIRNLRRSGAEKLVEGVIQRLGSLAMPQARFEIEISETGIGDPIQFMFSSSSGERMGPVSKVASGGELSRLMLAIRLNSATDIPTMIFDEVDAGIGGRAAVRVGQALAELSRTKQVIVVTHLAQVAAFANQQVAITKRVNNGRSTTIGSLVEGEERVSELARMLSGHHDSEKARDHARELLAASRNL